MTLSARILAVPPHCCFFSSCGVALFPTKYIEIPYQIQQTNIQSLLDVSDWSCTFRSARKLSQRTRLGSSDCTTVFIPITSPRRLAQFWILHNHALLDFAPLRLSHIAFCGNSDTTDVSTFFALHTQLWQPCRGKPRSPPISRTCGCCYRWGKYLQQSMPPCLDVFVSWCKSMFSCGGELRLGSVVLHFVFMAELSFVF